MARSRHTLDPAQSALLVMDFQPYKLGHLPDAGRVLTPTIGVVDLARKKSVQVAHVWSAYTELDYATVPDSNRHLQPAVKDRVLGIGEPGSAIHEAVAPKAGDIVERKTRIGAFATTRLDECFTNRGIVALVLAGIFTSSTVLSTVRDAADRDYQLFVLEDCIADPDPDIHDFLVRHVLSLQAKIITSDQFDSIHS